MLNKPVVKGVAKKPAFTASVTLKKPVVKGVARKPVKL